VGARPKIPALDVQTSLFVCYARQEQWYNYHYGFGLSSVDWQCCNDRIAITRSHKQIDERSCRG